MTWAWRAVTWAWRAVSWAWRAVSWAWRAVTWAWRAVTRAWRAVTWAWRAVTRACRAVTRAWRAVTWAWRAVRLPATPATPLNKLLYSMPMLMRETLLESILSLVHPSAIALGCIGWVQSVNRCDEGQCTWVRCIALRWNI